MGIQPVVHNTFTLERAYPDSPERVFRAFSDPEKKRRWFVEGGEHHILESYDLDFRDGGTENYSLRFKDGTPVAGLMLTNEISYQNIVPNRRMVFTSTMWVGGGCISVSVATIELEPAKDGTKLTLTFQSAFLEGADGPAMREAGWRTLLERLATELQGD